VVLVLREFQETTDLQDLPGDLVIGVHREILDFRVSRDFRDQKEIVD